MHLVLILVLLKQGESCKDVHQSLSHLGQLSAIGHMGLGFRVVSGGIGEQHRGAPELGTAGAAVCRRIYEF